MGDLEKANETLATILHECSAIDKLARLDSLTSRMSGEDMRSLLDALLMSLLAENLRADILQKRAKA